MTDDAFWEDDGSQHNEHIWCWFDWQSGMYDDYPDLPSAEARAAVDRLFSHLGMASWKVKAGPAW